MYVHHKAGANFQLQNTRPTKQVSYFNMIKLNKKYIFVSSAIEDIFEFLSH